MDFACSVARTTERPADAAGPSADLPADRPTCCSGSSEETGETQCTHRGQGYATKPLAASRKRLHALMPRRHLNQEMVTAGVGLNFRRSRRMMKLQLMPPTVFAWSAGLLPARDVDFSSMVISLKSCLAMVFSEPWLLWMVEMSSNLAGQCRDRHSL